MNQILCTHTSIIIDNSNKKHYKKIIYKILLYILILLSISIIIYYMIFKYDLYRSEKLSSDLIDNFNIRTLYSNNSSSYTTIDLSENYDLSEDLYSSVIGVIEINKINITYPILSDINKEFLKIAPCKFYGPLPNEIGNLCIAGHNYKNNTFFSNLSQLENGDIITIYDLSGNYLDYIVYNIYTASSTDLSCMNQNTNNLRIITLITCNSSNNHYRTIVQAKEF